MRSLGCGADTVPQENEGLPEGWEARKDGQVHAQKNPISIPNHASCPTITAIIPP